VKSSANCSSSHRPGKRLSRCPLGRVCPFTTLPFLHVRLLLSTLMKERSDVESGIACKTLPPSLRLSTSTPHQAHPILVLGVTMCSPLTGLRQAEQRKDPSRFHKRLESLTFSSTSVNALPMRVCCRPQDRWSKQYIHSSMSAAPPASAWPAPSPLDHGDGTLSGENSPPHQCVSG
jgi:hypothetical protein